MIVSFLLSSASPRKKIMLKNPEPSLYAVSRLSVRRLLIFFPTTNLSTIPATDLYLRISKSSGVEEISIIALSARILIMPRSLQAETCMSLGIFLLIARGNATRNLVLFGSDRIQSVIWNMVSFWTISPHFAQ